MNAILSLEDGSVFHGQGFGAPAQACGEVCFNTSMTGYQEILTDPSYKAQIVTMTYPLIGNYGVNEEDVESWKSHVAGFAIRELSPVVSNWRAQSSLAGYLETNGIPFHDSKGTFLGYRSVDRDITWRKKAEEELRESEEKYRTVVENAGEAICVIDEKGTFLFMNTTGAQWLGGMAENYVGKTLWDVFSQKTADRYMYLLRPMRS